MKSKNYEFNLDWEALVTMMPMMFGGNKINFEPQPINRNIVNLKNGFELHLLSPEQLKSVSEEYETKYKLKYDIKDSGYLFYKGQKISEYLFREGGMPSSTENYVVLLRVTVRTNEQEIISFGIKKGSKYLTTESCLLEKSGKVRYVPSEFGSYMTVKGNDILLMKEKVYTLPLLTEIGSSIGLIETTEFYFIKPSYEDKSCKLIKMNKKTHEIEKFL